MPTPTGRLSLIQLTCLRPSPARSLLEWFLPACALHGSADEDGNSTMDVSRITEDGLPPPPQSASEFAADLQFDLETRQSQVCVRLTVQAAGGSTSIIASESRPSTPVALQPRAGPPPGLPAVHNLAHPCLAGLPQRPPATAHAAHRPRRAHLSPVSTHTVTAVFGCAISEHPAWDNTTHSPMITPPPPRCPDGPGYLAAWPRCPCPPLHPRRPQLSQTASRAGCPCPCPCHRPLSWRASSPAATPPRPHPRQGSLA